MHTERDHSYQLSTKHPRPPRLRPTKQRFTYTQYLIRRQGGLSSVDLSSVRVGRHAYPSLCPPLHAHLYHKGRQLVPVDRPVVVHVYLYAPSQCRARNGAMQNDVYKAFIRGYWTPATTVDIFIYQTKETGRSRTKPFFFFLLENRPLEYPTRDII